MIIACEKCQTRFKVGDEKFAAGPIRVRCSKCNHVFLASGPATTQPAVATAPPPALTPQATPGPITGMFAAYGGAPPSHASAGNAGGFASPQNRSGLFRPPSQATTLPPTVPNALATTLPSSQAPATMANPLSQPQSESLPPTTIAALPSFAINPLSQPTSSSLPPTTINAKPEDPFRGLDAFGRRPTPQPKMAPPPAMDPFAPKPTPMPTNDPFASAGTVGATPRALAGTSPSDPFGFGAPPAPPPASVPATSIPRPPTLAKDPFAGLSSPPPPPPDFASSFPPRPAPADPFAGLAAPAPARTPTKDPFAGLAAASPPVPDPFGASAPPSASAFPDPFSSTEPFNPQSLFGATNSQIAEPIDDPFGAATSSPSPSPSPHAPPPPPPSSGALGIDGIDASSSDDPFKGLEDASADVSVDMSDPPPPPDDDAGVGMVAAPASALRKEAASSSATFASPPPTTGADMRKLRRLETTQRVREIAWAAAQIVLLVAFIAVAVVVARGGRLDDVLKGDLRAALGGPRAQGALIVEDAHVARRTLPSGIDVVVVTGVVVNNGPQVPAARVDVRFGDGPWASGWAWSSIDGVDVDGLRDAPDAAPLSLRGPKSPIVQPGDRAPFVVIAPAPAAGLKASFAVTAAQK